MSEHHTLFEDEPAPRETVPPSRREARCRLSWEDGNGLYFRCSFCPRLTGQDLDRDTPLFALILHPCST